MAGLTTSMIQPLLESATSQCWKDAPSRDKTGRNPAACEKKEENDEYERERGVKPRLSEVVAYDSSEEHMSQRGK